MKPIVFAIVTFVAGCAGKIPAPVSPPTAGWIDLNRVRAESTLGKRLADEHTVVVKSRQEEVSKISQQLAAAEKAKDKDLDAKRAVAQQKVSQFDAEIKQHGADVTARLVAAIQPIAVTLRDERHMARVDFEEHLTADGDLTDEVIHRLDAQTYTPPVHR